MPPRFQPDDAPEDYPVSVAQFKDHARLSGTDEDTYLGRLVQAGCEAVERRTGRVLPTRTLVMWLDGFPNRQGDEWWNGVRQGSLSEMNYGCRYLVVPKAPLIEVGAIKTYDLSNTESTFDASNYTVDATDPDKWGRIILNDGSLWPVNLRAANSISVELTVGYGDGSDVAFPEGLRQATLEVIAHAYSNRGDCAAACDACSSMLHDWIMRARL